MAEETRRIPNVLQQPPSVDFIENRLPNLHPAFQNLPVRYDAVLKRFVPDSGVAVMPRKSRQTGAAAGNKASDTSQTELPDRPLSPPVFAMKFWGDLFEESMKSFQANCPNEPERLAKNPDYTIRTLQTWAEIHDRLQAARVQYDSGKSTFLGRFKRVYRKLADGSNVMKQAVDRTPDNEYVSPVKAVLEVAIDIIQVASDTRQEIVQSIEDLDGKFERVEVFVATFPKDENIKSASVNLLASILKVVEETIDFFLSSILSRAVKAAGHTVGVTYQERLLQSILQVEEDSEELKNQALLSHNLVTKQAMELIWQRTGRIELLIRGQGDGLQVILKSTDRILQLNELMWDKMQLLERLLKEASRSQKQDAELVEKLKSMMDDGFDKLERRLEEKERRWEEKRRQEEEERRRREEKNEEIKRGRSSSPGLPVQPPWTQPPWGLHLAPPPYYAQYLQPLPMPRWPPHAQPTLQDYQLPPTVHVDVALSALQMLDIDKADINAIMESSGDIPSSYRKRSQQIIVSREFRHWASSPDSCELLIQGQSATDSTQASRAMTLISAALMENLRRRGRFISLAFFCGNHTENEDDDDDEVDEDAGDAVNVQMGPNALLRSLITQLLQQHYGTSVFREQDMDFKGLSQRDMHALCRMFEWLVRQVPQTKIVVCLIDSVDQYETEEWEKEMTTVLRFLLRLAHDKTLSAAFKVLVTSPTGTLELHEEFGDEDGNVLYVESLQSAGEDEGFWGLGDESAEESE